MLPVCSFAQEEQTQEAAVATEVAAPAPVVEEKAPEKPETVKEEKLRKDVKKDIIKDKKAAKADVKKIKDEQKAAEEKLPEEEKDKVSIPLADYPLILLDTTQGQVESSVTMLSNRADSFFGSQRADDELNRSQLRLIYNYRLSEQPGKADFAFRVNLRLQNLENWFKRKYNTFRGKKTPTEEEEKTSEELSIERRKNNPYEWIFRTDAGASASILPKVFVRSRLRKSFETRSWLHRFVAELGWYSEEQWINNTTFESDYVIKENKLFRVSHEANYLITDQEFTTRHGPSILHTTSDSDAFAYNARILSRAKYGAWYHDGYSLSIGYRRRLRGTWLYGDITPALDFPKVESYRRTPSIFARVEILFGGIREDSATPATNTTNQRGL